jgi:hypothetical protein
MRRISLAMAIAAGLVSSGVSAHHGFGTFLMDEDIEITGTVTGLDFVNPHSWLYLDVKNDAGETVAMRCEMRSANTLRRSGWTPDLFPVGKVVTISGSPDRNDPYSCYVSTLIFDDGSRLDRYGQITSAAPSGNGERPQRLANGQPNLSGDWAQEQVIMTDPRGQYGTLVPLSEAGAIAASGDFNVRGAIPGARGTEQAAAAVEATRAAREAAGNGAAPAAAANAGGGGGGFRGGNNNLTEAGQAALARHQTSDRYALSCVFTSVVSEWGGEPVNRVTQRGDTITIQYGRLGVERTIHLDMTAHPASIEPSLAGHSIGRWDGDTLVVDTVGFTDGLLSRAMPNSEQLHLVEEFRLDTETNQLRRSYTATDPVYWTQDQTGSNAMDMSNVAYSPEVCEDLTLDRDVQLGPRGGAQ